MSPNRSRRVSEQHNRLSVLALASAFALTLPTCAPDASVDEDAPDSGPRARVRKVAAALQPAPDPTLLGYWNFDEASGTTALDASGHNQIGTITNATRDPNGRSGGALYFNGTNATVSIPDGAWNVGTPATYSVWYKADGSPKGMVFEHRHTSNLRASFAYLPLAFSGAGYDRVRFAGYDSTTTGVGQTFQGPAGPGVWMMATAVVSLSEIRLFKNGAFIGTTPITGGLLPKIGGPLYIGARGEVPDNFFKGWIDEFAVYGKALTDTEVTTLYQSYGAPPALPWAATGLVGRWKMDEGGGPVAADSSGFGGTGDVLGATWDANGVSGSCLRFNGTSSLVRIPDGVWNQTGNVTYIVWYKNDTNPTGRFLLEHEFGSALPGLFYLRSDHPGFGAYDVNTVGRPSAVSWFYSGPPASEWRMLALVLTPTNATVYSNGVAVGPSAVTAGIPYYPGRLFFGGRGSVPDNFFKGWIDEVSIYARSLNAADLLALYNQTVSSTGTPYYGDDFVARRGGANPVANPLDTCTSIPVSVSGAGALTAEVAMSRAFQDTALMSRPLEEETTCHDPVRGGNSSGLLFAYDAVAVVRGEATMSATNACTTLANDQPMLVTERNGVAGMQCPACLQNGSSYTYTFYDSLDVLRVLYAGMHHDAGDDLNDQDCNSDVRQSLVANWHNLYSTCSDQLCGRLEHAFRPSDQFGTVDQFLRRLNLPRQQGTRVPFCNGTDLQDLDPIRRGCEGDGTTSGDQVCQMVKRAELEQYAATGIDPSPTRVRQGDAGVVLPITVPAKNAYPDTTCQPGTFDWIEMPDAVGAADSLCPNGTARQTNRCLMPKSATGQFGCRNLSTSLAAPTVLANADGRAYNKYRLASNGAFITFPRPDLGFAIHDIPIANAWYLLRTGFPSNPTVCQESSSSLQIGCLVTQSQCSLGIASRGASELIPAAYALALNGQFPTNQAIRIGFDNPGDLDGYPISHGLYFNTTVSAPSLTGFQNQLTQCFAQRPFADAVATYAGAVKLDDNGTTPVTTVNGDLCGECTPDCSNVDCGPDPVCGSICSVCAGGPAANQSECQPGLVLRYDVAERFGYPHGTGICWDAICDDMQSPYFDCGYTDSRCGLCPSCVPSDCEDRQCGSDGCWGKCGDGSCDVNEAGCESIDDCDAGLVCVPKAGARVGVSPELGVCMPSNCLSLDEYDNPCLHRENEGELTDCGECPLRSHCDGRECGDDGAGGTCGGPIPTGFACVNGQLITTALFLGPEDVSTESGIGTLPGTFAVTHTGEATYRIPLDLPRGRGDLTPDLALSYSSARGNGLLGAGWALEGLETIARCDRDFARDQETSPTAFDDSDAFCMNGDRLVPTGNTRTVLGQEVPEYAPEHNDGSSAVAFPASSSSGISGPERWEVTKPNGRVYRFGGSPTSTMLGLSNAIQTWALSRVTDRSGNYAEYYYRAKNLELGTGVLQREYVPDLILYSKHVSDDHAQVSIAFVYEDRPDRQTIWRAGANIGLTQRLKRIAVISPDLDHQYVLYYDTVDPTRDPDPDPPRPYQPPEPPHSRLSEIQDCVDRASGETGVPSVPDTCRRGTTFEYKHGLGTQFSTGTSSRDAAQRSIEAVSDFNGDGRDDLLVRDSRHNQVTDLLLISNVSNTGAVGFTEYSPSHCPHCEADHTGGYIPRPEVLGTGIPQPNPSPTGYEAPLDVELRVIDMDGDGRRDDLIDLTNGTYYLLGEHIAESGLSIPENFTQGALNLNGGVNPDTQIFLLDLNGDGLSDLMSCTLDDAGTERGLWNYSLGELTESEDSPNTGVILAFEGWQEDSARKVSCPARAGGMRQKDLSDCRYTGPSFIGEQRYYQVADVDNDGDEELLFVHDDEVGKIVRSSDNDHCAESQGHSVEGVDVNATVDARDVEGVEVLPQFRSQPAPAKTWSILHVDIPTADAPAEPPFTDALTVEDTQVPWRAKVIDMNGDGLQDFYQIDTCASYRAPLFEVCDDVATLPHLKTWVNTGAPALSGATAPGGSARYFRFVNTPADLNVPDTAEGWALMSALTRVAQPFDWDGDGNQDIVIPFGASWHAFTSNGAFFAAEAQPVTPWEDPLEPGSGIVGKSWRALAGLNPMVLDVNGDRLPDLLTRVPGNTTNNTTDVDSRNDDQLWGIMLGSGPREPRLVGVTNGFGEHTHIGYGQLSDPFLYPRDLAPGSPACVHPQTCVPPRGSVVSAYSIGTVPTEDDPDGTVKESFIEMYQDARSDAQGRGFLGFGLHSVLAKAGDFCPGTLPGEQCPEGVFPTEDGGAPGFRTTQYTFDNYTTEPTTGMYYRSFRPASVIETRSDGALSHHRQTDTSTSALVLESAPNTVMALDIGRRERVFDQRIGESTPIMISDLMHSILTTDDFGNPTAVLDGVTDSTPNTIFPCRTDVPEGCTIRSIMYTHDDGGSDAPGFRNLPRFDKTFFFQDQAQRPWNQPDVVVPELDVEGFSNVRITQYDYDANGRLATTTYEPQIYDTFGDLENLRKIVTVVYDDGVGGYGNVVARSVTAGVTHQITRSEYIEYDSLPQGWYPSATVDALGFRTELEYDWRFGTVTTTSRAATSNPVDVTMTRSTFDDFGRLKLSFAPDGTRTEVEYQADYPERPLIVLTSTAGGPETIVQYDTFGRAIHTSTKGADGGDLISDVTYDALDRVIAKTRPHYDGEVDEEHAKTHYTYDAASRLVSKQWTDAADPEAPTVSEIKTCYAGPTQCTRNARGFTSCARYDQFGRLAETKDPAVRSDAETVANAALPACATVLSSFPNLLGRTSYRYGEFLERITDAQSNMTRIVPDRYGRRRELNDPDTGLTTTTWNAFGDVVATLDGNGQLSEFEYDAGGRKTLRKDYPLSGTGAPLQTRWFYDGHEPGEGGFVFGPGDYQGALSASVSPEGHVKRYKYDEIGQPIEIAQQLAGETASRSIKFQGYLHGKPQVILYPGDFPVQRIYGTYGHLLQVITPFAAHYWSLWDTDAYDLPSAEIQGAIGDGTFTEYTRDNLSRIRSITDKTTGDDLLRQVEFAHDANSNVVSRTDVLNAQHETLGYDQLDRLTSSTVEAVRADTEYDRLGNITSRTGVGAYAYEFPAHPFVVPGNPQVPDRFKPHAVSQAGSMSYEYDVTGNLVERRDASDHYDRLSWTPFGKVHQMWRDAAAPASSGTGTVTFGYDADGNRVRKQTDTVSTTYLEELYERRLSPSGAVAEVYYIRNGARVVAQLTATTVNDGSFSELVYMHGDVVGSAELMTGEHGAAVEPRSYTAFGNARSSTDWNNLITSTTAFSSVNLGFTGHETDREYGLVNMKGRIYDPVIARFLSADPFVGTPDSQGLNRYSYVRNNPLKYIDPSGYEDVPASAPNGEYDPSLLQSVDDSILDEDTLYDKADGYGFSNPTGSTDPTLTNDTSGTSDRQLDGVAFDSRGAEVLNHWLEGSGEPIVEYEGRWGEYMRDNDSLRLHLRTELLNDAWYREESGSLDIMRHEEISDNGYNTGYEMLHGTNANVGDFVTGGEAVLSEGPYGTRIDYNLHYQWNDIIDPNSDYISDTILSTMLGTTYSPSDYNIHLSWDSSAYITFPNMCDTTRVGDLGGYPFGE